LSGSASCWPTPAWSSSSSGAIGAFEDLLPGTETVAMSGRAIRVIGLEDLIRIRRYLGRAKDRQSLLQLEAIRRLRETEGLR
jgi:hypothetical protein